MITCIHRCWWIHSTTSRLLSQNQTSMIIPACSCVAHRQWFSISICSLPGRRKKVVPGDYPQKVVSERAYYIVKTKGTRSFPWGTCSLQEQTKSCPPMTWSTVLRHHQRSMTCHGSIPAKALMNDHWCKSFNVPLSSGVNTASYKYYIDFLPNTTRFRPHYDGRRLSKTTDSSPSIPTSPWIP